MFLCLTNVSLKTVLENVVVLNEFEFILFSLAACIKKNYTKGGRTYLRRKRKYRGFLSLAAFHFTTLISVVFRKH